MMRRDVLDPGNKCFFDFKKQTDLEKKMLGIMRELRNNVLNAILASKNAEWGRGLDDLKDVASDFDAPVLTVQQSWSNAMKKLCEWFGNHVSMAYKSLSS